MFERRRNTAAVFFWDVSCSSSTPPVPAFVRDLDENVTHQWVVILSAFHVGKHRPSLQQAGFPAPAVAEVLRTAEDLPIQNIKVCHGDGDTF